MQELKNYEEYSQTHVKYARILKKRQIQYKLSEERFYKLRGKLQEWLNHSSEEASGKLFS